MCAATAFGVAAVLQGIATRDTQGGGRVDPGLLLRLLRRPAFLAALVLNIVGFGLHVTALQTLPLFLVQSVISCSVAVTAVLSVRVFAAPLSTVQWAAVGAVLAGLAMLGPTATSGAAVDVGAAGPVVLLGVVIATIAASVAAIRLPRTPGALLLGLLAGISFGVVAVSARLLPDLSPLVLIRAPGVYVLAFAGLAAFLLYSTAMQRGSVTTTTAAMVVTQTAVPALIGAAVLGDRVRVGLLPLAIAGFCLSLLGALGLARFEADVPSGGVRAVGPHP